MRNELSLANFYDLGTQIFYWVYIYNVQIIHEL